jgi:hypothetical protein
VLRGQPCPLTYHQKNKSHPAVTRSIHGIEGDVRKFTITATLGGIVPIVTTNSATRIPRRIAGRRLQKWLNIEVSAVEQRYLAIQRYPQAQQNRTGDKEICFRESPRE